VIIIVFRLTGRLMRNNRLFSEDKIMAWSIIPLLARMGCIHVVLIYGTNNIDTIGLTDPEKIHRREIGSRCVLAARIFYAMFIWMAKITVSEFLKRLTERFWKKGYQWCLRGIRIFLVVTFVIVVIATLAECQPFDHYWQVIPDPGPRCRQGYTQLLTMSVTDGITDVLLVAFPIPIIFRSAMPLKRKFSLTALFSMSIVLIVVTGARVPLVIKRQGIQQFRTVFASSEILAATTVANAIVLGSFLRDRGVKKAKFRAPSTTDSMERRGSARRLTDQPCSSDEDLARSLGYRTKPELSAHVSKPPRPAPVANLDLLSQNRASDPFADNKWRFPGNDVGVSPTSERPSLKLEEIRDPMPSPRGGRRVSWVDAGGLLDNAPVSPSPTDSVIAHDFAAQPRRGSRASNSVLPNGRANPPPARRASRLSQQAEEYEMSMRPSQQLQDLGGLLSEDCELEEASSASPHSKRSLATRPSRHSSSIQRSSTHHSDDTTSLHDPSGIPSAHLPSMLRTSTRTSYSMPTQGAPGPLFSQPRPHTSPRYA
jgi:hypothetical protein